MDLYVLLDKALAGQVFRRDEIVRLLLVQGYEQTALFYAADTLRRQLLGEGVHLRALIEVSNYCIRDCLYCGLRRSNQKVKRYRLQPEEIVAVAQEAAQAGYYSLVLQAGEDPELTTHQLAEAVAIIKKQTGLAITLSLGVRSRDEYKQLKAAGADRYLIRHETADAKLYAKLHPGDSLPARVGQLGILKEVGYQVGSGMMVGLPGQSLNSLADDILLLRSQGVDMVGLGPFVANPQTPLAGTPSGDLALTLNVLAVTRLVVREVHMPATTALGTIHPAGRRLGLMAGANVIMPVFTPGKYSKLYNLYPDKVSLGQGAQDVAENIHQLLTSLGRHVAKGPGHSIRKKKVGKGRV